MNYIQTTDLTASPMGENRKRPGAKSGDGPGVEKVDKIRELIFGEQMAAYEARFNALESRLVGEIDSLRQSVEDSLSQLKELTEKRSDEVEKLSVSRKRLGDSLEKLADHIRS